MKCRRLTPGSNSLSASDTARVTLRVVTWPGEHSTRNTQSPPYDLRINIYTGTLLSTAGVCRYVVEYCLAYLHTR